MTDELKDIRDTATRAGACALIDKAEGWKSLCLTLLSPQGIEFLQKKHNDESIIGLFRAYGAHVRAFGVYVDSGEVRRYKSHRGAFFGQTNSRVLCEGTEKSYTFVVLNGARLELTAKHYAVVRIYNFGGEVVTHNDGTAAILR